VRLIDCTVGCVWRMEQVWPAKLPLAEPRPPSGLPPASRIESSSTRFSLKVPWPEMPLKVTVYADPLPLTTSGDATATPPDKVSAKSVASTPVTGWLNVTSYVTLEPVTVSPAGLTRSIDAALAGPA